MKHRLLSLLTACLLAVSGFAAVPYVLNESFEAGLPSTWSQEVVNTKAGGAWVLDTLTTNPAGAYEGTHRVAMRDLDGSFGHCVRLVTPALDLSAVAEPVLSFAYAQPRQSGFSDTLSVYFRASEDDPWVMIRKYSNYQGAWSLQTLDLPAACRTATCQLAFEAKQAGGWGVVLDQVRVYPHSQCLDVDNIRIASESNAALISWAPRANRAFELVVSPTAISNLSAIDDEAVIYHNNAITGVGQVVSGLSSETQYYVYVRTDCDDNESGYTRWVDTTFVTPLGIPYTPNLAAIPSSWEQMKGDVAASVVGSTLTANTGSYKWQATSSTTVLGVAHLYAQSNGTPSWLLTQPISFGREDENSSVLLSFKLALTNTATTTAVSTSAATAKFHIYASADEGDTWTLVRTIEGSEISNTGLQYNILLDDYLEAASVRLAFVADAQATTAYFHLAQLSIVESDGLCLGLYGLKPSVTESSITLAWTKIGRSATVVSLSDVADFTNILQQQTVNGSSHTFSNLTSSTTYFVKVRQDCAEGDSIVAQLKTPCPPTTISSESPYVENFDDPSYGSKDYKATDGLSPDCWMVYADGSVLPHVVDSAGGTKITRKKAYKHSGTRAMSFYGDGTCTAVLPGFTNALNTLKISFWMQTESTTDGTLTFGYITDGDLNFNTFHTIATYANNTGSMIQREADLSELPDNATNLVFRWYVSGKSSVCAIDDIEIRPLPQCRKVKGVAVTPGAAASVLTFTDNGAPKYDILVTTKRLKPDTLQTTRFTAFRDTVMTDTAYLTGLAATTTFYAYVQPICEDQEEPAAWSDYVSFTTPCGAVSVTRDDPWKEDFESYAGTSYDVYNNDLICWEMGGTTTHKPHVANSGSYGYYVHSGTKTLSFYGSSSSTSYAALPIFAEALNLLQISCWFRMESASAGVMKLGYITNSDPGDFSTFVEIETLTGVTSMTNYEKELSALPAEAYRLVFYWEYSGSSYYTASVDDIEVSLIPTCHKMGALSLGGITSTSATLQYAPTNASQYQVVLSTKSINPAKANLASDTIVYNQLVSTTSLTISDLTGNTKYYAYVRGYCGDDDYSVWSDEFSFKTLCTAVTPEAFGVETFNETGSADCWTFGFKTPGTKTTDAYAQRDSQKAYGGYIKLSKESVANTKNAAGMDTVYNDGAYAVSPELDIEDIRNYQVSFDAATFSQAATNYKRLNVGVMVDPTDLSGIDIIKTIDLDYAADSMSLKTYSVSFANYEGDYLGQFGKFVIFELYQASKHDSTNFVLIDNVSIEPVATCPQVIESAIDSIEGEWAAISWENTGAAEYEVMLSQLNTRRPDTISAPLFADTIAEHHIIFNDLTGNSLYYAYVRAICGEGDTAKWSNAIRFHTNQTPVLPPFTDDFEEGNEWLFINGEANTWEWGTAANHGGTHALYITDTIGTANVYSNNKATVVFATKSVKFTESGTYSFSYDWRAQGESTYDYLRVALAPIAEELTSGVLPSGLTYSTTPKTWIALDGGSKLNGDSTWNTVSHDVKVDAGTYKVVLTWRNDGSVGTNPPAAVDNFSIVQVLCPKPTGLNASLTPGNGSIATLSWNKGGQEADAWVLQYTTDTVFTNAKDTTIQDSIVDLTGLTPEAKYYARVKATCGEEAESDWSQVLTFTPTNAYTLLVNNGTSTSSYIPFYGYDADGGASHSQFIIPSDSLAAMQWSTISQLTFYATTQNVTFGGDRWNIYMAEGAATSLSSFLDWSSLNLVKSAVELTVEDNRMVITLDTPFDYEDGDLLIGFKQASGSGYASVTWTGASATSGASYYSYTSTYSYSGATSSASSFLPKMTIYYDPGEAPSCPKVRGIQVENILADSALVIMPDMDVNGYHLIVTTAPIGIDSITASDSAKIIFNDSIFGETELQLTDLNAATPYYIYARAICDGEHGLWANPVSFKSACGVLTIAEDEPWRENFESYAGATSYSASKAFNDPCWMNIHTVAAGTTGSTYLYYINTSASNGNATQQLCLPDMSSGNMTLLATPVFNIPEADAYEFQLDIYRNASGTSYPGEGVRIYASLSDTIDASAQELAFISRNVDQSYGTVIPAEAAVGWYTYKLTIPVEGDVRILVQGESKYGSSTYMDNFVVRQIPSCLPISGLAAELTQGDGTVASLHWTSDSVAAWRVQYATSSEFAGAIETTVSDTAFIALSGLTPETKYYARVKAVCGDGAESEWSDAISFTPTNALYITVNDGTATGGNVPIYGFFAEALNRSQFIIPAANLTNMQWGIFTQLTFYASEASVSWGAAKFEVYMAEVPSTTISELYDWSALTKVMMPATLSIVNNQMVVTLDNPYQYADGNLLIGFKQTTTGSYSTSTWYGISATGASMSGKGSDADAQRNFLPKMTIGYVAGEEPTCFKPSNIAIDSITATSASLSFTLNDAAAYDVLVTTASVANPDTLTTASLIAFRDTVSNDTVAISGLNASTNYFVYVRSLCGDDDRSNWSAGQSFTTLCDAIVVTVANPWSEDFETYSSGAFSANCWENEHITGSSTSVFSISTSTTNGSNSSHQLYLPDMQTGTQTLLSMPTFALDEANGYVFKLDVYRKSYSSSKTGEGVHVYASLNGTFDDSAVKLAFIPREYSLGNDTIAAEAAVGWYTYELLIPLQGDVRLFILGTSEFGAATYMDNFQVQKLPACRDIKRLKASSVTTSSANISFVLTPSPEYDLVITTAAIKPDTIAQVADSIIFLRDTVTDDTTAISGLAPSTDYYVYLRGICSETEVSAWANTQFRTPCLAAVPYSENFDDTNDRKTVYSSSSETFAIPTCWNETYGSTSYVSGIVTNTSSSTFAYSGTSALRLYSSASYGSYLVLPEMDASLDTLQLTFKARAMYQGSSSVVNQASSTYAHSVMVGTLVDPADFSTFKLIETYELEEVATAPSSAASYWEDVTIYLQGAAGKFITLVTAFDKTNYVYIDDVEVSRAPDCIAPSAITVLAGTTTADITWASLATEFEVALGHEGFAVPAGADTIYTVSDTTGLHITDLEQSMNYDIYIRTLCEEHQTSAWSRVRSFATGCPVPFTDDFEDRNQWTLINGTSTNAWAWGSATSNGGSSALYISNDNGASNAYTITSSAAVYATKTFAFEEDGGYIFQYDWKANGEVGYSMYDYLRVALVPAETVLTAGSTPTGFSGSALPSGWLALDGGSCLANQDTWQTITSDEITLKAGIYMVVFAWRNDGSTGTQTPAAIDNFSISKVSCSAPTAPTVTDITTSSAVVRWDTLAPAYEVALIRGTDTVSYNVTGRDTLLLENLNASTGYVVRLRAHCAEEDFSRWSAPVGFATLCEVITVDNRGWVANFDELTSGIPACWDNTEGTTSSAEYRWNYYATGHDGACLRFNSYSNSSNLTNFLATPELELTVDAALTFWWKNPNGGAGEVLISTDGGVTKTSLLNSLTGVSEWTQYEIDLSEYTGQTVILYFKGTSNFGYNDAYLYLDDISVAPLPNCRAVKDMKVLNISASGVTLNFRFADGQLHNAHVAISREAAFDYSTAMLVDTIADTTYTFNVALQDKVTYYVYARQACDGDEVSAWKSISFVTPYVIRYEAEFATTTIPDEWTRYSGKVDDVLAGTAQLTSISSGWNLTVADTVINAIHFRGNIYGTDWDNWVVSPLISLAADADAAVQLRFEAGLTPYSNSSTYINKRNDGVDDRFVVLVTTDNGASWTSVAEWNNSGSPRVYNDIPGSGQTYIVDLSAFIGQSVRVAFYGESTQSNADNYFHFGNIVINYGFQETYQSVICDGNDYVGEDEGNPFYITPDEYQVGENEYELYRPAANGSGLPDSIFTLHLTVMGTETFEDSVTLCEGEHFSQIINGGTFDFDAYIGMEDQVRFVRSEFGCRNIVRLKIAVNPKVEAHVYDSVAQGDEYKWHGQSFISATTATFDTLSLVTGCDSIVYLHLSVYQLPDTTQEDTTHAIPNIHAHELIIAPNPVKVGEPIRVRNTFSAEQLAQARIEIVSATGALVYVQHGAEAPLSIPGLPISGMYAVRIIVGKEIFISSLLVY